MIRESHLIRAQYTKVFSKIYCTALFCCCCCLQHASCYLRHEINSSGSLWHVSLIKGSGVLMPCGPCPVGLANLSVICETWRCHRQWSCLGEMCPWSKQSRFQDFKYTPCAVVRVGLPVICLGYIYGEFTVVCTLPGLFSPVNPGFQFIVGVLMLVVAQSLLLTHWETCREIKANTLRCIKHRGVLTDEVDMWQYVKPDVLIITVGV